MDIFGRRLRKIEKRLLEIGREQARRKFDLRENYTGSLEDTMEADYITYLPVEKEGLMLERQFILDKREGLMPKLTWNLMIPIVVAIIVSFFTTIFVSV